MGGKIYLLNILIIKYFKLNISLPFICKVNQRNPFTNIVLMISKPLKSESTFKCFQDNIFEQSKYFHYGKWQYNILIIW